MTISTPVKQNPNAFGVRLLTNKWFQLLEIIIVFFPPLLVIIGYRMMHLENPMLLIAGVWFSNVIMLLLVWISIKLRRQSWQSIGLYFGRPRFSQIGWSILKSVPILVFAIAAFIVGAIVMANIVGIQASADMTKYNYLSGNIPLLLISLAGVYIASSFGEEVVYRGFLITRLQNLFGGQGKGALFIVLVFSSIIFGFAHFEWGATGIVQTTFMGAALGASFLWNKRRLWSLVLAHGYMDTLLMVQLYLTP